MVVHAYEQSSFDIPRSKDRVLRNLKKTDDWMPLLFSYMHEGKRIKGKQGHVGAKYKAKLYKSTQAFSEERDETFEIVTFTDQHIVIQYQAKDVTGGSGYCELGVALEATDAITTKVTLQELDLQSLSNARNYACWLLLCCLTCRPDYDGFQQATRNREEAHEEFALFSTL